MSWFRFSQEWLSRSARLLRNCRMSLPLPAMRQGAVTCLSNKEAMGIFRSFMPSPF